MDDLLARLGAQAMNMVIRSGLSWGGTYAVQQCSRLLKTVDDDAIRAELRPLQHELNQRIQIITPAIDLIEFKAGRGNAALESAVPLAKSLRWRIVSLGKRLEEMARAEEMHRQEQGSRSSRAQSAAEQSVELRGVIAEMKSLLARIERDAQMLQFAIQTSGESLSTSMPSGVSASRLMQASALLMIGDEAFASMGRHSRPVQIGPSFTLSLYMLFVGHSSGQKQTSTELVASGHRGGTNSIDGAAPSDDGPYGFGEGERKPMWQEVMHKARVRLCRIPPGWEFDGARGYVPPTSRALVGPPRPGAAFFPKNEYSYHVEIIEDLDDGRLHDSEGNNSPSSFDELPMAGIRESIPVHQLSKIFYTNTGRILNIGQGSGYDNNPALLLKRDVKAPTPRQVMDDMLNGRGEAGSEAGDLDEDGSIAKGPDAADEDPQAEVEAQLRGESRDWNKDTAARPPSPPPPARKKWGFPKHLDTEWLALDVFENDEDDSSCTEEDEASEDELEAPVPMIKSERPRGDRSSLDSKLMAQIREISLKSANASRTPSPAPEDSSSSSREVAERGGGGGGSFTAKSPWVAVTSSLSMLEMLVRLASLQEFRQMSHLSTPDHIINFFLEETATTGLAGEQRWQARTEAKKKVGFDPYSDVSGE